MKYEIIARAYQYGRNYRYDTLNLMVEAPTFSEARMKADKQIVARGYQLSLVEYKSFSVVEDPREFLQEST